MGTTYRSGDLHATTDEQATDAHNAQQLVDEITARLQVIEHESQQIGGLLDDLAIYLPKVAPVGALNPNHRNDGFVR